MLCYQRYFVQFAQRPVFFLNPLIKYVNYTGIEKKKLKWKKKWTSKRTHTSLLCYFLSFLSTIFPSLPYYSLHSYSLRLSVHLYICLCVPLSFNPSLPPNNQPLSLSLSGFFPSPTGRFYSPKTRRHLFSCPTDPATRQPCPSTSIFHFPSHYSLALSYFVYSSDLQTEHQIGEFAMLNF